jgi:uncharacterized protein YqeY
MSLKERITEDMKTAMRAKELNDAQVLAILEKMLKQRKDAIQQFMAGARQDLADKEQAEIEVIAAYLPQPASAEEIAAVLNAAVADSAATGPQDMGKVMALVKTRLAGRADMTAVSAQVKQALSK